MPPEDGASTPTDEPITPEDAGSKLEEKKGAMPPTAPKGKPKAPPLIYGKIKASEADGETGGSSRIPLLKTKHVEVRISGDHRKHPYSSAASAGSSSARSFRGDQSTKSSISTPSAHQTVEKVRLPKGIEMRRIVQESNGVKTKRYSGATGSNSRTTLPSATNKESSQSSGKKPMTKTVASFPEVKTFTGHGIRSSELGSNNVAHKTKSVTEVDKTDAKINSTPPAVVNEVNLEPEKSNEEKTDLLNVNNFKTVDEFLKMPETALPEAKAHSPVRKTIYKSKFWEYIDPKNDPKSKCHSSEHKKPYDPDAVKSFMQKQKEMRKSQQMKEAKQREEELAKRQRMLKELDSKCHKIASKNIKTPQRYSTEGGAGASRVESLEEELGLEKAKKPKLDVTQSPSLKYLKPLLERKQGSLIRKSESQSRSDVAKQSQILLAEFENIVKRECISFLQKIPSITKVASTEESQVKQTEGPVVSKVDKAVSTSASLLDLNSFCSELQKHSSKSDDLMDMESLDRDDETPKQSLTIPSPATVEKAVTKIQACFRGYKVRQALREAKVVYQRPVHKRCSELLGGNVGTFSQRDQNRRWSSPKLPEKPYDNLSRIQPMSPIPMRGISFDFHSVSLGYIPPPSASSSQTPRSPSKPRVLPSFPVTPNRTFDEPYPKQVDRTNGAGTPTSASTSRRDSFQVLHPNITLERSTSRPLPLPFDPSATSSQNLVPRNSRNSEFDFVIPSSIPSIVDVLKEKLRLFSKETAIAAASAAAQGSGHFVGVETPKIASSSHSGKKASSEWKARKVCGKESGDISTTTTTGDQPEDGVTPKLKRHKRRSRPRSQRSPVGDSTTTIDTDGEYNAPTATRSSGSVSHRPANLASHTSTKGSKSENAIQSTSQEEPTTTTTFDSILGPALHLRYEAERERLKIIEKALQVKLLTNKEPAQNEGQSQQKKSSPEVDRVQLAIANCQKESMKAAAEMAKWMSEFQKTTREQDRIQVQQTPIDLAATVIAAVEHARVMGLEKRRERVTQEKRLEAQATSEGDSSFQSEIRSRMDKSCETSLNLIKGLEKVMEKEKQRSFIEEQTARVRNLRDYQMQFPSESERDSPVPTHVLPAAPEVKSVVAADETGVSRKSSPEDMERDSSQFQEPIEYPSIIPSGNSIEFTSLDPRVSTLDFDSQISSEKEATDQQEVSIVEEDHLKSLEQISNVAENVSFHESGAQTPDDVVDHSSDIRVPSVVDEAVTHPSADLSKVGEELVSVEVSKQSNMEIEDEATATEVEVDISEESRIEEFLSEQSKIEEAPSEQSKIEEVLSEQSKIEEVLSEHSKIKEVLSEQSKIEEVLSEHSMIEEILSEQSKIEEVPSEPTKIEDVDTSNIEETPSKSKEVDYQVQSPSESERDSPVPTKILPAAPTMEEKSVVRADEMDVSRKSANNGSFNQSGNQSPDDIVDHSSDIRVSSVVDEAVTHPSVDLSKVGDELVSEEVSKQSHIEIDDEETPTEVKVDVSEQSKSDKASSEPTKLQDVEASNVKEIPSKAKVVEEELISEQSRIEEILSESKSKIEEAISEPSRIEEDLLNANYKDFEEDHDSVKLPEESPPSSHSEKQSISQNLQDSPQGSTENASSGSNFIAEEVSQKNSQPDSMLAKESVVAEVPETSEIEDNASDYEAVEDKATETELPEEDSESEEGTSIALHSQEKIDSSKTDNALDNEAQVDDERQEVQLTEKSPVAAEAEVKSIEKDLNDSEPESTVKDVSRAEFEIPLKPPPPYSPSSSLESTSLSSRSIMVSVPDDKLEKIIRLQADVIWEAWKSAQEDPDAFPDIHAITKTFSESSLVKLTPDDSLAPAQGSLSSAEQNFDTLVCHLVYETIKEVLQVRNKYTSFIERVRPGPLSLQAQKLKIPKTKEALVANVLMRVIKIIPSGFFPEPHLSVEVEKPRLRKWCSRPRELVDEILLEELVEEDYQWTEWWPEEVIIKHHISTKIIQNLIRNALQKRKYVNSQAQ